MRTLAHSSLSVASPAVRSWWPMRCSRKNPTWLEFGSGLGLELELGFTFGYGFGIGLG